MTMMMFCKTYFKSMKFTENKCVKCNIQTYFESVQMLMMEHRNDDDGTVRNILKNI